MLSRHLQLALLDPTLSSVLAVPTRDGPRLTRHPDRWPDHLAQPETLRREPATAVVEILEKLVEVRGA